MIDKMVVSQVKYISLEKDPMTQLLHFLTRPSVITSRVNKTNKDECWFYYFPTFSGNALSYCETRKFQNCLYKTRSEELLPGIATKRFEDPMYQWYRCELRTFSNVTKLTLKDKERWIKSAWVYQRHDIATMMNLLLQNDSLQNIMI